MSRAAEILARVARMKQQRSQAQPAPRSSDLLAGLARMKRQALAKTQVGEVPVPVRRILDPLIQRMNRKGVKADDRRPSRVLAGARKKVRSGEVRKWIEANPGLVLQYARKGLLDQPSTPLAYPPKSRTLRKVLKQGRRGIINYGTDQLVNRPIAAEAFSGGGLYEIALWVEGVYVNQMCELNAKAIKTLQVNLHTEARERDALKWEPYSPDGGLDLLTGGPPCKDFTQARALGGGNYLGASSARNMYPKVLDWIADTQPRVVLLENSGAVAVSQPASERGSRIIAAPGIPGNTDRSLEIYNFFVNWWRNLDALGYEGHYWILYAPDYGTPQNRVRAWVVAWPKGAPWAKVLKKLPPRTHGHPASRLVREGKLLPWVSAFDREMSGCCGGYGLTGCMNLNNGEGACFTCEDGANFYEAPNQTGNEARLTPTTSVRNNIAGRLSDGRLRSNFISPIDLSPWSAFATRDPIEQVGKGAKVVDWLARAMVAHAKKDATNILIIPPDMPKHIYDLRYSDDEKERRVWASSLVRMSVRDMAKIQDVPMWWKFVGGKNAAMEQIGNGIPVNMGRAVARQAIKALGYECPLPGTESTNGLSGLWPYDRLDPCVIYNAPFAAPGAMFDTQIYADMQGMEGPYRQLTPQLSRKRPVADFKSLRRYERKRKIQEQRRQYWREHYPGAGVQDYIWETTSHGRLTGTPPGFGGTFISQRDDLGWMEHADAQWQFYTQLQGTLGDDKGARLINHLVLAYTHGAVANPDNWKSPGTKAQRRAGVRAMAKAMSDHSGAVDANVKWIEQDYDLSLGLPDWSVYNRGGPLQ